MREGWKIKKLKDVCLIGDGNYSSKYPKASEFKNSGVPFITATNLKKGTIIESGLRYISREQHSVLTKGHINEGDLVVVVRGSSTGNSSLVPNEFDGSNLNSQLAFLRSDIEILNRNFLFYVFNSPNIQRIVQNAISGSAQPQLPNNKLLEIEIPIPPLQEQQQIVAILDEAFEAIDQAKANIEKNIENAKELFDSKKEELFEKLSRNSELMPINKVCEKMFAGGDKPKPNFSKVETEEYKIPVISNGEKNNGLFGYTNEPKVVKPSITISARGTIGFTVYRDYPFVPIVRLIVLTPNLDIVEPEYLMHAVKSLDILKSGSSIPQLTVPMMKGYSLPIPNKTKQQEVIELLNSLESKLHTYKFNLGLKLNELEELKKSILQKAFAGELTNKMVAV